MTPPRCALFFTAAVCIAAALAIIGHDARQPWLAWVFKPLTTLLVIAYAAQRAGDLARRRRFVLLGLALSLLGDVALLWPQQGFVPGLVAFLLAHLSYLVAFTADTRLAARPLACAAYAVVAVAVLTLLWPGVPSALHVPVLAYVLCLAAMAAQAACWWLAARGTSLARWASRAAAGGACFVVSDALLATDRFVAPLPHASVWVLGSYWLAQWLIAGSLAPIGCSSDQA